MMQDVFGGVKVLRVLVGAQVHSSEDGVWGRGPVCAFTCMDI